MRKVLVLPLLILFAVIFSVAIKAGMGGYSFYKYEPAIHISNAKDGYSAGGLVSIASTDEPAINIGSYDSGGTAELTLYEADENALFDYLTHDKDNKQIKKDFDLSKFKLVTTISQQITKGYNKDSRVTLPLSENGIWLLRTKLGNQTDQSIILRTGIGVLVKEAENDLIFWAQDFKTGKSVTQGIIKAYSLENSKQVLSESSLNANGIGKISFSKDIDIAYVKSENNIAIVPLNLKYLNTGYSGNNFQPKVYPRKYFVFTDRPLYKPGDTIYFKAVLRDDNDVRYSIPSGFATVKIYQDEKNPVLEKNYEISPDGTVYGETKLEESVATGYYTLKVVLPKLINPAGTYDIWESNTTSFQVEFFRKPEYSIDMEAPVTELISKDPLNLTVTGKYFSGQPLTQGEIKYTVSPSDFWEYEVISDRPYSLNDEYRYGSWYSDEKSTTKSQTVFNSQGQAKIDVNTTILDGKSKVFSIEATFDNGSGNPSLARKNILVYSGEYGIYRKDYSSPSGVKVGNPLKYPLILVPNRKTNINNVPLTVKVHREEWIKYIDPNQKYPQYRKEEEDLPGLSIKTDNSGNAVLNYTPQKIGSYIFTVEGRDPINNLISKKFYAWVSKEDIPYYSSNQDTLISLVADKTKYNLKETMNLSITSELPDRDVFLSVERARVDRYQVVHLKGKSGNVELPVLETDMPNIFVAAATFSNTFLEQDLKEMTVSTDTKKLVVSVTPNQKIYGPSDTVNLNITTKDISGNPVLGDLAVWAVDKALFELVDEKPEKIFETFWATRYHDTRLAHSLEGINVQSGAEGGGCFAPDTKILMSDGSLKEIQNIKKGDFVKTLNNNKLTKAKVTDVKIATTSGLLIINQTLKTTPDHIINLNGNWDVAGNAQTGDILETPNGTEKVSTIEYIKGVTSVYNLEIDKYHTFFAQNYFVHNQKGTSRTVFKDTAYWNPSVHTDQNGRAQVSFKLPDNLTTWVVSALGSTSDTKAGQVTTDIVVGKSLIVRPVIPNILREKDKIAISAIVQNFTEKDQKFNISLKFDGGEIENPDQNNVLIKSNETKQVFWNVTAGVERENSKLTFSAISVENEKVGDTIIQEIPVLAFGFYEKTAEVADGAKDFQLKVAPDSDTNKSKITLSLSPTLIGTLPLAMKYLVDYPYGCTEQTVSRFVPAVIAKANQNLFAESLEGKDLDAIINKGVSRLASLQHPDGGWSWWEHGNSDLFITSYVLEYLTMAKNIGIKIDENILNNIQRYLQTVQTPDPKAQVLKAYAFSKIGKFQPINVQLDQLSPDILSMYVLADPSNNGLALLKSKAQAQGDSIYWTKGAIDNFGSDDASTALALRALLAAGDRESAVKAARFLMRNRKGDYWSNTFATSQVVRAITELSTSGSESSPSYTYTVSLDSKEIAKGEVNTSTTKIKDIEINLNDLKKEGSVLSLKKIGDGQLYSTLLINEFHTDRNSPSLSHGLNIKREYVSERGETSTLAVGDAVDVKITVGGLSTENNYMVIDDNLPSGLVPINPTFNNELTKDTYYNSFDVTDWEITQNGMILSLYKASPGERTYTYKARVIAQGVFIVPPVVSSLMYSPEIHGRSNPQIVKTSGEAKITSTSPLKQKLDIRLLAIPVFIIFIILIIIIILKKKLENHP